MLEKNKVARLKRCCRLYKAHGKHSIRCCHSRARSSQMPCALSTSTVIGFELILEAQRKRPESGRYTADVQKGTTNSTLPPGYIIGCVKTSSILELRWYETCSRLPRVYIIP